MEDKRIKNALYNYYAISRFEKEKHQDDPNSPYYLVNYYAEDMLKSLLNNAFDLRLYQDAYLLLENLDMISDKNLLELNKDAYNVLVDCDKFFDSKLLRHEDPIEYVMKILGLYLNYYEVYERKDDEDILCHRYDIIAQEMINNSSFGSLFIKMTLSLINKLSSMIKALFNKYRSNILVDSLMMIKGLYHNLAINLLFKDIEHTKVRLDILGKYLISLVLLFDNESDNNHLVMKLDTYSDYYYSINHNIKTLDRGFDVKNFNLEFGFLDNPSSVNYYAEKLKTDNIFQYYLNVNNIFHKFLNDLKERFNDIFIDLNLDFDQIFKDIDLLLNEMKVL